MALPCSDALELASTEGALVHRVEEQAGGWRLQRMREGKGRGQ